MSVPGGATGKESVCQCRRHRDAGLIPESERSPGEGNGNPLQYSCLENPTDRGAWWATVHGDSRSRTWLSTHTLDIWLKVSTLAQIPNMSRYLLNSSFEKCKNFLSKNSPSYPLSLYIYLFIYLEQHHSQSMSWIFFFWLVCWPVPSTSCWSLGSFGALESLNPSFLF